jgi:hypothetical protein
MACRPAISRHPIGNVAGVSSVCSGLVGVSKRPFFFVYLRDEEEGMDWTPIDYNPQDRLDPGKCIAGHNAIADVRETVYRTCPVMGSVEPACTMYREENGQWYRSKEPVTWGEMRIFTEGH